MFVNKTEKGFTLIELLVVISIIGLLSSVVLASLRTARTRAADAVIKSQLSMMRTSGQLSYETSNYDTLCDPTSSSGLQFRNAFDKSDKSNSNSKCL